MGIRCDFYVGRGADAEWIGSVAWDGYPEGGDDRGDYAEVWAAKDEREFRLRVGAVLARRDDSTLPEHGWPWPWKDSHTTDWAYAIDGGVVHASCFGQPWIAVGAYLALDEEGQEAYCNGEAPDDQKPVFPDMKHVQNTTFGRRSGVTLIQSGPGGGVEIVDDKDERDERRLPGARDA